MIIVWHELDLRLEDHEALYKASQEGEYVIPLFIYSAEKTKWSDGAASKWWLHHSLTSLSHAYKEIGGKLILKKGDPFKVLQGLIKTHPIKAVYYLERFEKEKYERDQLIKRKLSVPMQGFNGNYLICPRELLNKSKKPYCVYTPFYRTALKEIDLHKKLFSKPRKIQTPKIPSDSLDTWKLLPKKPWYEKLEKYWEPGRLGAKKQIKVFQAHIAKYATQRDIPAIEGTSRLSPHLHFGEISPREVLVALGARGHGATQFVKEIIWREFANYFLFHFPTVSDSNWKKEFNQFPWKHSKVKLEAWQKGQTGYPIIDAGMRQLWQTGWMHNRVRMIVASFLIKDLMIHWKEGASWFWDTLVDADLASNSMNWQWVAGSGPDASPFFRIFNPTVQGKKFDPEGEYVKKYVPELKKLPSKWVHTPWLAPEDVLKSAGIVIGENYPSPIVDHDIEKKKALSFYQKLS